MVNHRQIGSGEYEGLDRFTASLVCLDQGASLNNAGTLNNDAALVKCWILLLSLVKSLTYVLEALAHHMQSLQTTQTHYRLYSIEYLCITDMPKWSV